MRKLVWALSLAMVTPLVVVAESDDLKGIDPVMGNWEGDWSDSNSGASGELTAKIIARGKGMYKGLFLATVEGQEFPLEFPLKGATEKSSEFSGKINLGEERGGEAEFKFEIEDGELEGTIKNDAVDVKIDMERTYNKPESIGAKPPEGAVVLFDGKSAEKFTQGDGKPAKWEVVDGALRIKPGSGSIVSKDKFDNQQLHIEFRTPFLPLMRGQGRGNSGVYVGGNFEIQVLDSFGEEPKDNEAGGIYKVSVPKENASLPPGEWQAYDITYFAPKTDASGKVTEPGEITVVYNGTPIHEKLAVTGPTAGGIGTDIGKPNPLMLQDHGNLVEFRNIWIKPIPPKGEAK